MKKHNFFAGPAILPKSVISKSSEAVTDFNGMGLSLLEISHRSKDFVKVMDDTEQHVRTLLKLSDDFAVLFLTGGASSQFFMTAMNLANSDETVGYVDTGTWSSKAIKEAKHFTNVELLASSKESAYSYIPYDYQIPDHLKYVHLTSNNTIYGTQTKKWPNGAKYLVCDMSSDIFSREVPIEKFGLIYAGAQKNVGPAGMTLVIVRKDILGKVDRPLPSMLDYRTHINKQSSYNTPPVFPIYVTMLTLEWIIEKGGVAAMEARNSAKAKLLYEEIDSNPLFEGTVNKEDRSPMNATFRLKEDQLEGKFIEKCKTAGIIGLPGHRSVGGFRASMYNALEIESVHALVNLMKEFAQEYD